MASLDSPNSPPNISFAIRPSSSSSSDQTTTTHHHNHNFFLRSLSTKEPPPSSFNTPPRFPSTSLHASPNSSPHRHSFTTAAAAPANHHHHHHHHLESSYRCVSSVLKKDGQMLSIAASNGFVYTGSDSNMIRIWKLPQFTECGQLKTKTAMVVALEVSPDRVYAAYGDGKIRVWRRTWDNHVLRHVRLATIPRTGGYVRSYIIGKDKTMKHMGPITSLAINISDDILYSASLDKTVKVWRITDFKCIETIQAHSQPINALVVADDDGLLYTASDDATVRVWRRNFYSENQLHRLVVTLPAKCSPVKALTLTPDDGILYCGCTDGYIHYWHKGWFSGQIQYGGALQGHTHAVMCVASVANYVVSGSADCTSRVWAREPDGRHTILAVLVGHRGPIRCVTAFLGRLGEEPDDEYCTICTASLDGVLKMWRVTRTKNSSGRLNQNGHEYFALQEGFD